VRYRDVRYRRAIDDWGIHMRNKTQFWLLAFVTTLMFSVGLSISAGADSTSQGTSTAFVPIASPTPQPACPPSCDHIFSSPTNRFVIKLKVGFQKENLLSVEQVKAQRSAIQVARTEISNLILSMQKQNVERKVEISVDGIPYLVILADAELLKVLSIYPKVERLYIDNPMNEVYDLELDAVEIDWVSLYGASSPVTTTPNSSSNTYEYCGLTRCIDLLERAKAQNEVHIIAALNLGRPYIYYSNPSYESAQQAVIRSKTSSFLKNYHPFIRSFTGPSKYGELYLWITYDGLKRLLTDFNVHVRDLLPEKMRPFGLAPTKDSKSPKLSLPSMQQSYTLTPAPNENIEHMGVRDFWNTGIEGQGSEIIIIDTGIHPQHTSFGGRASLGACDWLFVSNPPFDGFPPGCYNPNKHPTLVNTASNAIECWTAPHSPTPSATFTATPVSTTVPIDLFLLDPCSTHGTYMASIAIQNWRIGSTDYFGVARQSTAYGTRAWLIRDGLRLTLERIKQSPGMVRAVSMSVGYPTEAENQAACDLIGNGTNDTDDMHDLVKKIVQEGVPIFAAAGDGSPNPTRSIDVPACYSEVISVGSVWPKPQNTSPETVPIYMNTFKNLSLLAPGYAYGADLPSFNAIRQIGSGVGTSQATANAAAAYVLLKQKYPNLTVPQLINLMKNMGVPVYDSRPDVETNTVPRVDIKNAIHSVTWVVTEANDSYRTH
jgi:subtilisin family serine protease